MVKNPSQESLNTPTYMTTLKKFKHFKVVEPSLGILGFLVIIVCMFFGFFYLDYRSVVIGRFKWLKQDYSYGRKRFDFLSDDDGKKCDVFDGDWLWDEKYPLYESKDCKLLDDGFRCSENGRNDFLYTKWRWQPKDCNLPRFLHNSLLIIFFFLSVFVMQFNFWNLLTTTLGAISSYG